MNEGMRIRAQKIKWNLKQSCYNIQTEQIFLRFNLPLEGHIPHSKMPQFSFPRFYCQFKFAQCVEALLIFRPPPGLPWRPAVREKDQEI